MKNEILCVRGNCDTEVDQMVLEFPIMAEYALISQNERVIFATHGHHFNLSSLPPLKKGDILLILGKGHEDYQIIKDKKIHLSDREIVKLCLEK